MNIDLNRANKKRTKLTREALKEIKNMYANTANEVAKKINSLSGIKTSTGSLQKLQLKQLQMLIEKELKEIELKLLYMYKNSIYEMAENVRLDMSTFLKANGVLEVSKMFANVPNDVVEMIMNGTVYDKKWNLSKAIWDNTKKNRSDINKIIAQGVSGNKSTLEIAKDLEKYVKPSAAKGWKWSKVYPGTNTTIDYNAQRLARTLIAHAYQESIIRTADNNPFVDGIRWHSALAHGRTCDICRERHNKVYQPDTLPLDHPNGLCTMIPVVANMQDVSDRLVNWAHGKKDAGIDRFSDSLFPNIRGQNIFLQSIKLFI